MESLEVAVLDRTRLLPRKFRRITGSRLAALLTDEVEPADPGTEAPIQVPAEPSVPETTVGSADGGDNPVDAAPAPPENPSP